MKMTITGTADVAKVLREIAPREGINLVRTTVHDIAGQLAKSGKKNAPSDEGGLKKSIKHKRQRGKPGVVISSVVVAEGVTKVFPFYWRYLEYGQGPDGVEHAFFLRALQEMRPNMDNIYLQAFVKKLEARLARERKRAGK